MTDFSHLKQYEVTSKNTKEYPIVEIDGTPTLILCPANESNPDYMNGLLRVTGKRGARKRKIKIDAKLMKEMREQDKELYPKHVIVGWKNVVDSKGKAVKFSEEDATQFIKALPNWIFDDIRTFAVAPENFVETIDSKDKAGN